jgi:hypothetical protein
MGKSVEDAEAGLGQGGELMSSSMSAELSAGELEVQRARWAGGAVVSVASVSDVLPVAEALGGRLTGVGEGVWEVGGLPGILTVVTSREPGAWSLRGAGTSVVEAEEAASGNVA